MNANRHILPSSTKGEEVNEDTITIIISREDAIAWATEWSTNDNEPDELSRMIEACRDILDKEIA